MATGTEPQAQVSRTDTGPRFVLDQVGWQGYERTSQFVGDRPIRLTPDRVTEVCATSSAFPPFLPLDKATRLLKLGSTMNQSRWGRMVREWVRDELPPRDQCAGDEAG
jgi:hypothetical protein